MKIKPLHIIISFVILAISYLLSITVANLPKAQNHEQINVEHIETVINQKINILESRCKHLSEKFYQNQDDIEKYFYEASDDTFTEDGTGYFLYQDNELKCWTTNDIPLPTSTTYGFFDRGLINLNNGWYICNSIEGDNWHLVGLFRIKKEYSYENDILNNEFFSEFKIHPKASINIDSLTNSNKICFNINEENEYFYLRLPENIYEDEQPFTFQHFTSLLNIFLTVIFLFVLLAALSRKYRKLNGVFTLMFFVLLSIFRFLLLKFNFLQNFVGFNLFSPELFAESFWLPSLGDYLINVFFFIAFAGFLFLFFKPKINIKTSVFLKLIFSISIALIMFFSGKLISELLNGLVWNSSISFGFENILNLDIYSILGSSIIVLIIVSFLLILYRLMRNFNELLSFITISITLVILYLYSIITALNGNYTIDTVIIFNLLFLLLWICLAYICTKREMNYFWSVIILIPVSLITSEHFSRLSNKKEIDTYKVITYNLAAERDVGAEFFLKQTYDEIKTNEALNNAVFTQKFQQIQSIVNKILLSKRYFNKYEIQTTICQCSDSLFIEPEMLSVECFDFFRNQIDDYGIIIPGSNFYFLDNHNGRISYMGEISSMLLDSTFINIYVELNSKIFSEGLGYPELLLDKKLSVKKTSQNYNYAKYNKGHLISSKGDYKYRFTLKPQENDTSEYSYNVKDGYIHFKYRPDAENLIILSKPDTQYSNELVAFTYISSFLFFILNIIWLIINISKGYFRKGINLKTKIQVSFITILILSLILTGTISIFFIVQGYKNKQKETVQDKVHSVLVELEQNVGTQHKLDYADADFLNSLLVKYSNVFYTDINIYDLNGILLSSSRIELYDKGLKGRYLDYMAYKELKINNAGNVVINETVDNISYLSAYVPFRNYDNKIIAYLNLPYFARQNEFKEEISNFVIAISNVFLALILISIIIGIFISRQLTRPLVIIQDKIRSMDIKKKAEKIIYTKNDELGALIREYNRKVDELSESANKLAQSEREMAWREMAKQIAHEIKNPLTPMKLSVQYLERAYDKKDENWEKTYRKVSKNLIEQIDILSGIASEFSNFAKMPVSRKEIINLKDVIIATAQLYETTEDVDIDTEFNVKTEGLINADKEQMIRVFTNLVKNSIQAIPDNRYGKIIISLEEIENAYIAKVIDNGCGISENMIPKIFQPNFTTKSSGMGLGLSMVKSILISNNATIHFNTTENIGTEFVIEIPIYTSE
ncbi:MAG: ATP-binding protein [Bacteroidales bacterium]|nr:ATP-binding protein [Bacteroidales bacterium]